MTARMVTVVVALAVISAGLSADEPISKAPAGTSSQQVEVIKESCPDGQAGAVIHSRTYVTVGSGQQEQRSYSPWNTIASCMPIPIVDNSGGIEPKSYCIELFYNAVDSERRAAALFQDERPATVDKMTVTGLYYNLALINYAKRQALGCPNVTLEELNSASRKSEDAIAAKRK